MIFNNFRKKKILLISLLLFFLFANVYLLNLVDNQNFHINNNKEGQDDSFKSNYQDENLKTQDLSSDNLYSGIGAPWNVSHWANGTYNNLPVGFSSSAYDDTASVPLKKDWEGYQLNATIKELYETRNWVNGTFSAGNDDGNYDPGVDDSGYLQNWTFNSYDDTGDFINEFSGNYFDSGNSMLPGHDFIELRMDGDNEGYDYSDACWWSTIINIPRGKVINGEIKVAVYPETQYNPISGTGGYGTHWLFQIRINDILIDAKNLIELENMGNGGWAYIEYPLTKWLDDPLVFPDPLEGNTLNLTLRLIRLGATLSYTDYGQYQQIFIDNVSLDLKTEVKPEQIGLKLNGTEVKNNNNWGEGSLGIEGNWIATNDDISVRVNFSSDEIWPLGNYEIELETDLTLFTRKYNENSYYAQNFNSVGTKFEVASNSLVKWETYANIISIEQYDQTNMSLQFPKDVNITWISSNQDTGTNILDQCDNSTPGLLNIPVKEITNLPSGYWFIKGISPNYCEQLNLYKNTTINPSINDWNPSTEFLSGDYFNVTAKITKSTIIEDYIEETYAYLYIRFPNGSIWAAQNQIVRVKSNGLINFTSIRIPYLTGSDYIAGEYEVIVSWNNSHSVFGLNESGMISKKFNVIHKSLFKTDLGVEIQTGIYFVENIINDTILNVIVSFKDSTNDRAIEQALVYANDSGDPSLKFSKKSPGFYLFIFNASKFKPQNITLVVYANHSYYENKKISIVIDVVEETILTVDNDFLTGISQNSNFSILFNYTKKNNEQGINNIKFTTNWISDYYVRNIGLGQYNLTCNSTGYDPNVLHDLNFTVRASGFEIQEKEINVLLTEIGTNLTLFINGTQRKADYLYTVEVWQKIEVEVYYSDTDGFPISEAEVIIQGTTFSEVLPETLTPGYYSILLNATDLGESIDYLRINAERLNYKPESTQFIVQVIQRQTNFQLFLNNVNNTIDPNIELPRGSTLNITAKYYDITGAHIEGADVNLSLDYTNTLTEYKNFNQYSIIINTNQLNFGVNIIRITAIKTNYETQTDDIRVTIRRIKTIVSTDDGEDTYDIEVGESFTLVIELINLDFGIRIRGALVSYDWKLEDGDFEETAEGLYEAELKDVEEGSYTITILVSTPGGEYDFQEIEITLNVIGPKEDPLLFQILLVIAIIIATALTSYIIYYQRVLKYPKPVRKVRKYRRTLKKSKAPKIEIITREKAFHKQFDGKKGKIDKGKSIERIEKSDQVIKKIKNKSPKKMLNDSSIKSSKKIVDKPEGIKGQKLPKNSTNKLIDRPNDKSSNSNINKTFKKTSGEKLNKNRRNWKNRMRLFSRNLKTIKIKRILFLSFILMLLILNIFIISLIKNQNSSFIEQNNNKYRDVNDKEIKNQNSIEAGLLNDNIYIGTGAPWNVSHWANRTDDNLQIEFNSYSYDDTQYIPLGKGWEGYQLNASIKELYETRNWVNGTFHCGDYAGPSNSPNGAGYTNVDSNYVQNWTFYEHDAGNNNDMSGNYYDSDNSYVSGHDVLELRMRGRDFNYERYDQGDYCSWNSTINIPRGNIIDGEINVALYPETQYNPIDAGTGRFGTHWDVQIILNNVLIDARNLIELEELGDGGWAYIQYPLTKWLDDPRVFPDPIESNPIELSLKLIRIGESQTYPDYGDYQQVLIDNVSVVLKTEAKPEQLGLKLNGTQVNNLNDWGEGFASVEGIWEAPNQNIEVHANFSCNVDWPLGSYNVELKTDLNLFTRKFNQDSYYEQDFNSIGTKFDVNNNSQVNWEAYGHVAVVDQYQETNMNLRFPEDVKITWVSSNQEPEINILDQCDNSTPGLLKIPVKQITSVPSGYWLFKGISPNYLEDLNIYNDVTGVWERNSTFLSGHNINIRANITKSSLIQDFIDSTYARLYIRFPNGTIWAAQNQIVKSDTNGIVNFSYFKIPNIAGADYIAGKYEVIVTWNNSYSTFGLNETGIISKNFIIVHESVLEPDQGIDYIDNVIDDKNVNIKVTFNDKEDNTAIENAVVYTKDFDESILYFSEISPGFYLLEYNPRNAEAGNNILTIYANHSYYLNNKLNITLDVTKRTILTVDNNYITVPQNQNFSVLFNYTLKVTPKTGVDASELITDWEPGDYYFKRISQGRYNLTCNTSAYEAYKLYTLVLTVKAINYEPQTIPIRIYTSGLGASLELIVNGTPIVANDLYQTEVVQKVNVTAKYKDLDGNHLTDATVTLLGIGDLKENKTLEQYSIIFNATQLSDGINTISVFANKTNYTPLSTQFLIYVTQRLTKFEIWLNGINKTRDPSIILPIGASLNIRAKYTDIYDVHTEDATINLLLEGKVLKVLEENKGLGYYSTTINTDQLGLGLKTLTLDAEKANYENQVDNIRLTVRQILTEITTEDGEKTYEIRPGENFKLTIELNNLDFGGKIDDAEVSYDWDLEDGDLEETDDGVYEAVLENVPEGTYTIYITVFKEGGRYDFEEFKITLIVETPEGESLLFLILLIATIVGTSCLVGYLLAYHYVLKYPKPVRKVRKYRRTLKRKKTPSVDIISREKSFKEIFKEQWSEVSGLIKLKKIEKKPEIDKLNKSSKEKFSRSLSNKINEE